MKINMIYVRRFTSLAAILLSMSNTAQAGCTGSSPTWTTTPDYTSVSNCLNFANIGDTVNVLAGNVSWPSSILISKGLNLVGAGIGKTVIVSTAGHFIYQPTLANSALNSPFRVSGFTLDMGGGSSGSCLNLNPFAGRSIPYAPFVTQTKIRIDHNRITGGAPNTTSPHALTISLGAAGVADSNQIDGFQLPLNFDGGLSGTGPSYGGKWSWDNFTLHYGVADDNFWFEDNIMTFGHSGEADASLTQCQFSGRYSLRYNTINSLASGAPILDTHGNDGTDSSGAMYSCFGGELYGNQVNAAGYWLNQRGGKYLSFYNNLENGGAIVPTEEHYDLDLPATQTEVQHVHESYYWKNLHGSKGAAVAVNVTSTMTYPSSSIPVPALNQDFWTDAEASNGIRCGTEAAKPSSCLNGQAYWATNQSCNDLTGLVGDIQTYPDRMTINGILYRCNSSGTWTKYYQPLAYPHPLRIQGLAALLAPRNLRLL